MGVSRIRRAVDRGVPRRIALFATLALLLAGVAPFFSASPAAAQNINISLSKLQCDPGFEDMGLGLFDLLTSCTTPGAGVPFALVPDGEEGVGQNADGSGVVLFSGVTAGTGILAETAAEMSYSRVFCSVYATGDPLPGNDTYVEYDATSNMIGWSLNDNESLDCYWFNVPETSGDGTSTINVFKYACPSEVDIAAATYFDLIGVCTTGMPGVEFYLYPSDASEIQGVTDDSGFIMFEGVTAGALSLVEVPPTGYQPAAVFCATAPMGSGEAPDPTPVALVDGAMIEYDLGANYYLSCFWFNGPDDTQGTIRLTKYSCPEEYDSSKADLSQLYDNCADVQPGVHFLVGGPATTIEQVTDNNGQAVWKLDPGDYQLSETLPAGYSSTRTFCGLNLEHGGGVDEKQLSQSSFQFSIAAGDVIDCVVFNQAGTIDLGPSSLTIDKYTCPAGFDVLEKGADPIATCTLGTDDITFTLEGDAGVLSASTGTGSAPATVKFSDLASGVYLLTEETPEPIDMAFILSCTSDVRTFNYPFAPFAVIEDGGRLVVELRPGEDMTCRWFNVLEEQPGTVTITKYWCDGEAGNLTNCELFGGTIGFVLTPTDGGEPISLQTGGESGSATVEALGTYQVEEQGFTWCSAESDFVDANGNLLVEAGAQVAVDVYNCGPRPLQ